MTDKDIRQVLSPWWVQTNPGSLLVSEYGGLKTAIADMAAFGPGAFHACEIKSDHDTLRRLPGQLTAYGALFHQLSVVTGPRYLAQVEARTPDWVAVLLVEPQSPVVGMRAGTGNPVTPNTARALWIEEGQALCRAHGLRGYSRLTSWTLPDFIQEKLNPDVVEAWVLICLQRRYRKPFGPA